jgi:hypothetical protein
MNMRVCCLLCLAFHIIPCLNAQANDVVRYNGIPGSGRIQIYAHRAGRSLMPEQTLPAYVSEDWNAGRILNTYIPERRPLYF